MKNLSNNRLILIRKCIVAGCAFLCLFLMAFKVFNYTSSSSFGSGNDSITWNEGVSLYSFLFNGNLSVLDSKVEYLRDIFAFSYVIMWISFVLSIISLGVLIYGIFNKKILFSKIGSIILVVAMAILVLISFDSYTIGRTVKYLSIFNPFYIICLILSIVGLYSTVTIMNKSSK